MMRPYLALGEGPLEGYGAFDGFGDGAEGGHEPVAHRLHFGAAVRLQHLPRDALVLAEDGAAAVVAEARHHRGMADEVGEENGDEARASRRLRRDLLAGNMRRFGP